MSPTPATPAVVSPAHLANGRLARTVDLALDLGAPEERIWTLPVTADHVERCAQAGFTAIRLICALSLHPDPRGTRRIDGRVIERIDAIAGAAAHHGLAIVVANMLDLGLMADPSSHRERLLETTHELVTSLSGHGAHLLIEPLAEPKDALDPEWNAYLDDLPHRPGCRPRPHHHRRTAQPQQRPVPRRAGDRTGGGQPHHHRSSVLAGHVHHAG